MTGLMIMRPHHLLCTQGYSGKGYSPEFRICVTWQAMDEDGTPMQWIQILEREG